MEKSLVEIEIEQYVKVRIDGVEVRNVYEIEEFEDKSVDLTFADGVTRFKAVPELRWQPNCGIKIKFKDVEV